MALVDDLTYIKEQVNNIKKYNNLPLETSLYDLAEHFNKEKGYTFYDYLKTPGTLYIDTGINWGDINNQKYIEAKFDWLEYGNDEHLFGNTYSNYYPHFTSYEVGTKKYFTGTDGNSEPSGGLWEEGEHYLRYNVGSNNEIILDDETIITSSRAYYGTISNIILFRRQSTTNFNGKLYFFRIYDKTTNELLANFVPAQYEDGTTGLFDKITGNFFTGTGTGTFEVGND